MRFVSLEKANALIPKVSALVEELLAKRRDLAIALLENQTLSRGAQPSPAARLARPESVFPTPRLGERKGEILRLIHRIESFGCTVKDLDLGLVDFPGLRNGEPILLCWKLGEPRIGWWHSAEEGFAERQPIDDLIGR